MKLHKLIKEEYNSILKEAIEYNNIDFNQFEDTPQGIADVLNNHILPNLINISKLIIKIPREQRYDLTSVKEMIQFIENIKEDIDTIDEISEKYNTNDNDDYFDFIDQPMFKVDMIYDNLSSLFDSLDSILIDIDDKFDEFEEDVRKYI